MKPCPCIEITSKANIFSFYKFTFWWPGPNGRIFPRMYYPQTKNEPFLEVPIQVQQQNYPTLDEVRTQNTILWISRCPQNLSFILDLAKKPDFTFNTGNSFGHFFVPSVKVSLEIGQIWVALVYRIFEFHFLQFLEIKISVNNFYQQMGISKSLCIWNNSRFSSSDGGNDSSTRYPLG